MTFRRGANILIRMKMRQRRVKSVFHLFVLFHSTLLKHYSRAERRWMDRDNKAARTEKRKDEIKRIRTLVELAYANDPRVKAYQEAEKRRKEEMKQAKKDAVKAKRLAAEEVCYLCFCCL
jgi:hypothetical protein